MLLFLKCTERCFVFSNLISCVILPFYSASLRVASSSRKEEVTGADAVMMMAVAIPMESAQMLQKKVARLMGRLKSPVTQVVREEGYTCAYLGAIVAGNPHR